MWDKLVEVIGESGVLTQADENVMALYCEAYADWRTAKEMIDETGAVVVDDDSGRLYRSPYRVILNEAIAQMQSLGASLGLDPASRCRLQIDATAKKLAEDDKAKFFAKREGMSA
jgi:P27 family predicted phage terminase small subunit